MEVCYFTDLGTRLAYRALHAQDSGHLYVELLAPAEYSALPNNWEATREADLGYFGADLDVPFLSTIAAGFVELGRAVFRVLAY